MSKNLVAYFSASGVTARLAKTVAAAAGADLYEIVPAEKYTSADLDWMDKTSRSTVEMKDPASRPEMAGEAADVSAYETIYVGFPIWWYTAPHIIKSFLESHDLSGKNIVLFATSGGSGMGKTEQDLIPSAPGAVFKGGKVLSAGTSEEKISAWIKKLGL
ncbi:MAG: flavodoxin [Bacillota bacterium]|nr:flavodoxin [Bacillota bacterium]